MNDETPPFEDDFMAEMGDEEPIGYNLDFDWNTLEEAEVAEHDRIISLEADEALAMDHKQLNDLHAWALAQVLLDSDEEDAFAEITDRLIASTSHHPALDYAEITGERIYDFITTNELDKAKQLLERLRELEDSEKFLSRRIELIISFVDAFEAGEDEEMIDESISLLNDLVQDFGTDPYALMDIASDLLGLEELELSADVFEKALELAEEEADQELIDELSMILSEIEEIRDAMGDDDEDEDDSED